MENGKTTTGSPAFNAPEIKLHFLDYWRIIRIRKTVILAVFLLVTLTTTVVTFILPKSYASTVRMKVEKDAPDVVGLGDRQYSSGYDPYWVQTEFETIQSKSILYQVITNLDLTKKWAERFKQEGELRMDDTYAILKGSVDVRQARNTSLLEISAYSDDPQEAAVIANKIAEIYRESRLSQRLQASARGIETLETEWDKQDKLVKAKQAEVDRMKNEF